MLDIKFIRENKDLVEKAAKDKRFKVDLDKLLKLDDQLKVQKNALEVLQAERNSLSKQIGKASSNEEREELKAKVSEFKPKMAELEAVVKDIDARVQEELLRVPFRIGPDTIEALSREDCKTQFDNPLARVLPQAARK